MTLNNLKDVYIDQLQDLYSADRQALTATQKLHTEAKNEELKAALKRSLNGIERGVDALESIIKSHDAEPTGEFCQGMQGLVREVDAHVVSAEYGDDDARDAMIIAQNQRMAHYAIAGYGCVTAFAERLGLEEEARTLNDCLKNTYEGDEVMTKLAVGKINKEAV